MVGLLNSVMDPETTRASQNDYFCYSQRVNDVRQRIVKPNDRTMHFQEVKCIEARAPGTWSLVPELYSLDMGCTSAQGMVFGYKPEYRQADKS
jgi:hypothetical protein